MNGDRLSGLKRTRLLFFCPTRVRVTVARADGKLSEGKSERHR